MKRFALFFSLFLLCLVVKANPVTRSQALNEAKSFLATKGIELKSSQVAYRAPRKANAQENESSYYYIFNVGNDQGFVIVSGDDRTEEILGYSDTGSFDEENMPEPLKAWLEGYEKEIESIVEVDASETSVSSPRKVLEKTKKTIAPLTTSKWGNGIPYSLKVPTFDGTHAPVGCAPIAVAQLLYYYRNVSASKMSNGVAIDWSNMIDEYIYGSYNNVQQNAISNFMYNVGKSLNATYTKNATYVSLSAQHPALKNSFDYNTSMAYVEKEYYSSEDWDNVIYNEISQNRPVLYNAFSSNAGHTFLIDGYDSNGLFHINWGWKGDYNGFFRLSVLNKFKSGYETYVKVGESYNLDQSATLYAVPSSLGDVNSSNNILSAKFTSVSGNSVSCYYVNQSGKNGTYYFGLGYIDNDGCVKPLKSYSTTISTLNNKSSVTKSYSLLLSDFTSKGLAIGSYQIVPIYKYQDTEWTICQYNTNTRLIANVNNNVSLSSNTNTSLEVLNISFDGNGLKNSKQIINVSFLNNSLDRGYTGYAYMFASTSTTKGTAVSSTLLKIGKNDVLSVGFPFIPTASGTYNIWISTDSKGLEVLAQKTIKILNNSQPTLDISGVDFKINKNYAGKINNKRSIWGNTFDLRIIGIKNNGSYPISTSFAIWLRKYDSVNSESWNGTRWNTYGDNAIYTTVDTVISPHSELVLPILFKNLKLNTRYDIRVEYNSKVTGSNARIINVFPMVFLPAVTTWTADGESVSVEPTASVKIGSNVVAVDITDATVVKTITPNSNPNVLYYLGSSQTAPSGLANKNVVKGDVADNITLVDGKDFFVPKRFTAKNINFTTTPTAGVSRGNNNNWRTIALPFEVSSVKNTTDNVDIDWFHSDSDTGKNFWIRKFDKLDTSDNTVIFENTDEMLAYEPYIMNVPDDYWGKKWDLRNKNITFYGENAILHDEANIGTNSSYYNFIGTTVGKTIEDGWFLNDAGDAFKYYNPSIKSSTTKADYTIGNTVAPFRAYFVLTKDYFETVGASKTSLRIKFDSDSTTGIMVPFSAEEKQVDVYTINGLKVASKKMQNGSIDLSDLPKGIYVINGKKFIQY